MSIKARLKALVAKLPPPPFDYEPATRYAIMTISMVLDMVGDNEAAEEVLMDYAVRLLSSMRFGIENCKGYPPDEVADFEARCAAMLLLFHFTPPELRIRVILSGALTDSNSSLRWADHWALEVARLKCRLPHDLKPEVMGGIVEQYFRLDELDVNRVGMVCDGCGLMRPLLKSPCADTCTHCGCPKWTWSTRTDERRHDWREMAEMELSTARGAIRKACDRTPWKKGESKHAR